MCTARFGSEAGMMDVLVQTLSVHQWKETVEMSAYFSVHCSAPTRGKDLGQVACCNQGLTLTARSLTLDLN